MFDGVEVVSEPEHGAGRAIHWHSVDAIGRRGVALALGTEHFPPADERVALQLGLTLLGFAPLKPQARSHVVEEEVRENLPGSVGDFLAYDNEPGALELVGDDGAAVTLLANGLRLLCLGSAHQGLEHFLGRPGRTFHRGLLRRAVAFLEFLAAAARAGGIATYLGHPLLQHPPRIPRPSG